MRVSAGWPVAVAVAGLLAAGCSDEEKGKGAIAAGQVATVACPSQARSVQLPAGWAAPLPAGSVPVDVRNSTNGRVIVTSVVPKSESDILKEMQRLFASAGLQLTDGETEKRDAESNFTGNGITGRWGIRELSGCNGPATRIDMVLRKS
jgi:hypothetical protein